MRVGLYEGMSLRKRTPGTRQNRTIGNVVSVLRSQKKKRKHDLVPRKRDNSNRTSQKSGGGPRRGSLFGGKPKKFLSRLKKGEKEGYSPSILDKQVQRKDPDMSRIVGAWGVGLQIRKGGE